MATAADIIAQARRYVDDVAKTSDGWKQPADWLALLNPEIIACYRKWVRDGLISLECIDRTFTGPQVSFTDSTPMAIVGVVQNMGGGRYRPLRSGPSQYGRDPFWDASLGTGGVSTYWTSSFGFFSDPGTGETSKGVFDAFTVFLHPPDSSNYIIRYIPEPSVGSLATTVVLPSGFDDYLALLLARKALTTEGASSQGLERLIMKAEADFKMQSLSMVMDGGARVRDTYRSNSLTGQRLSWQMNPYYWYFV